MTAKTGFFDLFSPPDGFLGSFGWICGFTASPAVMNEVADRFTQGTGSFLATHRRHALFLITDHASRQIMPTECPGVHHMTLGSKWNSIFEGNGLFHAKVALLHFVQEKPSGQKPPEEILRLVVSTGNWTRETLESNIDLFWRAEVRCVDQKPVDHVGDEAAVADIFAAHEMFENIRPALTPNPWRNGPSSGEPPGVGMKRLVERLDRPKTRPRFFHSLKKPMRAAMLERFTTVARPGTDADMLLLGSGFYAGGDPAKGQDDEPQGAQAFLLKLAGDLTSNHLGWPVSVVLNPEACQGLAKASKALAERGWQFFEPVFSNANSKRTGKLHAKFIYRGRRDQLQGELYLGSGNLTPAGLGSTENRKPWNFEAGVVFPVYADGTPAELLSWNADKPIDIGAGTLEAGDPFERSELFSGLCPISHFTLRETDTTIWLEPAWIEADTAKTQTFKVEARDYGAEWPPLDCRINLGPGTRPPAQVDLRVSTSGTISQLTVPVLGETGMLVMPELHFRKLEDVLEALRLVDQTGRESDPVSDEDDGVTAVNGNHVAAGDLGEGDMYFSRRVMAVITALGESQSELRADQCRLWAARLIEHARSLKRSEGAVIAKLLDIKLNPFIHLCRDEFMPVGVDADNAGHLKAAHDQVAALWHLEAFEGFVTEGEV